MDQTKKRNRSQLFGPQHTAPRTQVKIYEGESYLLDFARWFYYSCIPSFTENPSTFPAWNGYSFNVVLYMNRQIQVQNACFNVWIIPQKRREKK